MISVIYPFFFVQDKLSTTRTFRIQGDFYSVCILLRRSWTEGVAVDMALYS